LQSECRRILEQVELYLDGELEAVARVEIERHLHACSPCMDHSEFQRHLRALLRSTCGCDEVPQQLLERIQAMFAEPSA
jgi:mycothiol system anti-sigma-R factor